MNKARGVLLAIFLLLAVALGYYLLDMNKLNSESKPILFIPKTVDTRISFWQAMNQGVHAAAKEYGVEVKITGALAETDIEEQIRLLEQAISEKPRAIVLAATDYNRLVPVSHKIKAAGIPLITVDSGVEGTMATSFISMDNYAAGRKAGDSLRALLHPGARVAIISFVKESTTGMERERGVRDSLAEGGFIVTETLYTNTQEELAYELTAKLLQSPVAQQLEGLISLNEPSTVGAARALKEQQSEGKRIPMVGFDSSVKEITFLEEGVLQAIVVQKPFNMGYLAIKTALTAAEGKKVEPWIDTGTVVITKSNMYSKDHQKLLFPFTYETP
ncbi:substrate-binding domain-containing protein [Paenibacillus silviterrae]|uniref:substrate-binding domain-containing protein n=1 Tax=Paenibacillus silviterrae TaxID=3242194 RepID=UPI002542FC35|nr:substrate-binding domain-containing protein [Paenibacillus chinjuensis]